MDRKNRAKVWIANEYKQLVQEMPMKKVTIQLLCQRCGINRGTFYYHFKDVFDLQAWIFQTDVMEPVREEIRRNGENNSLSNSPMITLMQKLYENKSLYRQALQTQEANIFSEVMLKETSANWLPFWEKIKTAEGVADGQLTEEQEAEAANILQYYSYAHFHLILRWIREGMKIEPEKMAMLLDTAAMPGLFRALYSVLKEKKP